MYTNSNVGCIGSKPIKHISQMLKIQDVHGFSFNTLLNDIKKSTTCVYNMHVLCQIRKYYKSSKWDVYIVPSLHLVVFGNSRRNVHDSENFFISSFNAYQDILYKLMNFPFILYSVSKMIGSLMLMFFPI